MDATQIGVLCTERGWTRPRLIQALRVAGRRRRVPVELPDDDSMKRMTREWIAGRRGLSELYAELFTVVFGVPFVVGRQDAPEEVQSDPVDAAPIGTDALTARLSAAASVDSELVVLFENQTQSFRLLDRRLGAARLLAQTEGHLAQMKDLLTYSLPGEHRAALAVAVAEGAALAGWQALDLGDPGKSWLLHETAKAAAVESGNAVVTAHVTAQQGYALLDMDRPRDAVTLIRNARETADGRVPRLMRAWLWAAEAEALAAMGDGSNARAALDNAARALPAESDEGFPFLSLNDAHLARWRGHCLARLGAREAVDDLTAALAQHDPSYSRAAAALHCDLALAYSVRGQHDEAREQARNADELAARTASARQRRRIARLIASGS
jgi:tetratricopeptide (TPR) repeat protein